VTGDRENVDAEKEKAAASCRTPKNFAVVPKRYHARSHIKSQEKVQKKRLRKEGD
jgi:hypothetical protein